LHGLIDAAAERVDRSQIENAAEQHDAVELVRGHLVLRD
jgi:hypothetical protein